MYSRALNGDRQCKPRTHEFHRCLAARSGRKLSPPDSNSSIRCESPFARVITASEPNNLKGEHWLMATLMYGTGMRLMECLRLRIKDVDFGSNQITIREGKGDKDRITMLPEKVRAKLKDHLGNVKKTHVRDLAGGFGRVQLSFALNRKYPNASSEWGWQFVFPQVNRWVNARTGEQGRHHVDESIVQKAIKAAVREAGIAKPATSHTFIIHSQRTCWKTGTTFARSKTCSATKM